MLYLLDLFPFLLQLHFQHHFLLLVLLELDVFFLGLGLHLQAMALLYGRSRCSVEIEVILRQSLGIELFSLVLPVLIEIVEVEGWDRVELTHSHILLSLIKINLLAGELLLLFRNISALVVGCGVVARDLVAAGAPPIQRGYPRRQCRWLLRS